MNSEEINKINIENVRAQISRKKQNVPFYATQNYCQNVTTDYDSFPYNRWYRGQAASSSPIVAEREVGFRITHDDCYKPKNPHVESVYPNHCFAAPCSTVFPCYPEYLRKYSDSQELNIMLNKVCTVQYR